MAYFLQLKREYRFKRDWPLVSSLVFSLLLTSFCGFTQTVRYVKVGGTGNGSNWEQASADLQAIINVSLSGDQIWVAGGIYKPGGNTNTDRSISFSMKNGVALYGGFQGNENALTERPASITSSQPSSTILSGDIGTANFTDDNSIHVINNSNLNNTAIIDGFIITEAKINSGPGSPNPGNGGGMYNQNSSPVIRNCQFTKNIVDFGSGGGGMYNDATSAPILINCTFTDNRATLGSAILHGSSNTLTLTNCTFLNNRGEGGGAVRGTTILATNCVFSNNIATSGPGGGSGGALFIGDGSILTNCLFAGNVAYGSFQSGGGAIFVAGNSTLNKCTFRGNQTNGYGGTGNSMGYGGAIYNSGNSIFTNCSFSGNSAGGRVNGGGGAIYNASGNPSLINCSFGNNTTNRSGGAIYNVSGNPVLTNTIVWGNTPDGIAGTSATLTYTDIQDNISGTGNLNIDPLFVDAPGDNLRLKPCSPIIDKGNNDGSVGTTDILGNSRQVRAIDMGAYEFQGTPLNLATITKQPDPIYSVPEGGTLTISVSTTGSVTSYQWYKDSTALTGVASATTASLNLTNITTADNGTYRVVVTGVCNSVTSTSSTLTVNTGLYTIKTGSWDNVTTWSLNRVSIDGDSVQLKHVITIPAGYEAHAHKVSFDSGQRLLLNPSSRLKLVR